MALADLLIGGLTEANRERMENQKLQKQLFLASQKAQIAKVAAEQKAQLAQMDFVEVRKQLEAKNQLKFLGQFTDGKASPGGVSPQVGQPQTFGQPGQQPSFRPQGQVPQPSPQDIQAQQSLIRPPVQPQAQLQAQPQRQPLARQQASAPAQQQREEPFIRVETGEINFLTGQKKTKLMPNPDYISPIETAKLGREKITFQQKQEEVKKVREAQKTNLIESAEDAIDTIEKIEKQIGEFGALGFLPSIPGTNRVVWEANVRKLMAQKVLEVMSNLKKASRTGSTGFGQLSEKELALLQDAATTLRKTLPPKKAQEILTVIKDKMKVILNKGNQGSRIKLNKLQKSFPTATNPQTGKKLIFKNGRWQPLR